MEKITVGIREYTVTEDQDRDGNKGMRVDGQITGRSGHALPMIDSMLAKGLLRIGYPVRFDTMAVYDAQTAFFPFNASVAGSMVISEFSQMVAASEVGQKVAEIVDTIDRRYHLAERMGIKLNRKEWLQDPISTLRGNWDLLVNSMWAEFQSPFRRFTNHVPRLQLPHRVDYQYAKKVPLLDGDKEWLQARLAEVAERIEAL